MRRKQPLRRRLWRTQLVRLIPDSCHSRPRHQSDHDRHTAAHPLFGMGKPSASSHARRTSRGGALGSEPFGSVALGANLSGAELLGANFQGALFLEANLWERTSRKRNLQGADLSEQETSPKRAGRVRRERSHSSPFRPRAPCTLEREDQRTHRGRLSRTRELPRRLFHERG